LWKEFHILYSGGKTDNIRGMRVIQIFLNPLYQGTNLKSLGSFYDEHFINIVESLKINIEALEE